ncbi:extracellular solute-binding protein [Paenibacillus eucommiae]|uniref:Aldouronate transport system substrate-binding protein n=1 Tax=Paenibacillus eucommiae TaxID=1355755 RepID=A0ABS4IM28_9BACL|nr:extracellular solute-binding protein [Paenibacillus eucommiae]MBP1988628.1 putative aldouronate transport system substrate-binding protein [Paenibacillus eucommiae]
MKSRRIAVVLLLCLMIFTAACSNNTTKGTDTGTNPTGTAGGTSKPVVKEPIDISFMSFMALDVFPPSEGRAVDMIKEKFQANIKSQFIPVADFGDKVSVLIASGDVPDVVSWGGMESTFIKFARQGAFLPIDDYIDKYESLKAVPEHVWDQLRIDGKIYSIPSYGSSHVFTMIIRQDWLDNLNLKMPTNYEELKQVAIAFTKNDPDGNKKNDTLGFSVYSNIGPEARAGAYWSQAWYHKDADGQYIPGIIGPGRKEIIEMYADAYAQGAVTKDFAVVTIDQAYKEFYSGKSGIFLGTPRGMSEPDYLALLKAQPKAVVASVPYFVAPDGSQGSALGLGYNGFTAISGKLKDQPEKIEKILEIMDFGRKWIPVQDRTPQNADFDWLYGNEGTGYTMQNGKAVLQPAYEKNAPFHYMLQRHEPYTPWAPNDDANQYSTSQYDSKEMQEFIAKIEEMERTSNKTPYADPSRGILTETQAKKGLELQEFIIGEQIKMISGARPITEWDKMVDEWKSRGGADWIKEMNAEIKEREGKK